MLIPKKNLHELHLTDEQMEKYNELEAKANALERVVRLCGVHPTATNKIVMMCDLNKVDMNNLEALEEDVKTEFADFIIKKGE